MSRPSEAFPAGHQSRCGADCGDPIEPGDQIRMLDGRPHHNECIDDDEDDD